MRLKGGGSPTPMLDINRKTMAELSQSFSKVPEDRKGLVVVTHIVGFSRLMSDFGPMDYGRAFFGNLSIGEMAIKAGADVYYCGHSHGHKEFHLGNTRCMNNGSDYGKGSKRYDVIDI